MSIPDTKHEAFAKWVESKEVRNTPIADWWMPPLYARETIEERVEPWATQYDEQQWQLPWSEDGEPDPQFYAPTPLLIELQDRLGALREKGFREIPNPDYDAERAAAYWAKQRARYSQPTITVGQSYSPQS